MTEKVKKELNGWHGMAFGAIGTGLLMALLFGIKGCQPQPIEELDANSKESIQADEDMYKCVHLMKLLNDAVPGSIEQLICNQRAELVLIPKGGHRDDRAGQP